METEREKHNKRIVDSYSASNKVEPRREDYLLRMPIYRAMNWRR